MSSVEFLEYPSEHIQLKDPSVLLHTSLLEQLVSMVVLAHSSMSEYKTSALEADVDECEDMPVSMDIVIHASTPMDLTTVSVPLSLP